MPGAAGQFFEVFPHQDHREHHGGRFEAWLRASPGKMAGTSNQHAVAPGRAVPVITRLFMSGEGGGRRSSRGGRSVGQGRRSRRWSAAPVSSPIQASVASASSA